MHTSGIFGSGDSVLWVVGCAVGEIDGRKVGTCVGGGLVGCHWWMTELHPHYDMFQYNNTLQLLTNNEANKIKIVPHTVWVGVVVGNNGV